VKNSVMHQLFIKYSVPVSKISLIQKMISSFRIYFPLSMAIQSPFRYALTSIGKKIWQRIKSL
jgi:hypothetical protein